MKKASALLFIYSLAIIISACSKPKAALVLATEPPPVKAPVYVTAGAPHIVSIDTCPPPTIVPVINTDSAQLNVYRGKTQKKITIRKPAVTTASFFLPMQHYNTAKGLALDAIIHGFEDSEGSLWFTTNGGGVTRYNGNRSTTFTGAEGLGNNGGENVMQDEEGNIWYFGGGMAKYDGRSIINLTKNDGLISNEPRTMIPFKDHYVVPTREGVSLFDGKHFTNLTNPESYYRYDFVTGIKDNKGNLWFGTREAGLLYYDGKQFTRQDLPVDRVICSYYDHSGNIWLGGRGGEAMRYDGKSYINLFESLGLPRRGGVNSIAEDNKGNIWIGTWKGGAWCYNGDTIINITDQNGLSDNTISKIFKDRKGNIWFCTAHGGADCLAGDAFTTFTKREGLPDNTIRNIIEDNNGNYWFGTNAGGVCKYDGKQFTTFSARQGLLEDKVHRVFQDRSGNIWFGTNWGLCRYDGKNITIYTEWQGLAYVAVRSILQDKDGIMWLGTERGLTRFDGQYFSNYYIKQGLPSNNVRDMVTDDQGRIWIGTHEGGIALFDDGKFLVLDETNGLTNNFIHNLTTDSHGNIWVCTANRGVSVLRKSVIDRISTASSISSIKTFFENFTKEDGLSDNTVYDMVEDHKGNIILGTNVGLTIVKGGLDPSKPISRNKLEYYSSKNGYPIKDVNTQSMYVDKKGITWIGTGDKLVRFDYNAIRKDTTAPLVKIQGVKINNENLGWYSLLSTFSKDSTLDSITLRSAMTVEEKITFNQQLRPYERDSLNKKFSEIRFDSVERYYPVPINLSLPYRYNNVSFDFAAIEPARPEQVRYQYILEGYDRDWSPVTVNTTASFGNIDEGEYTFKVRAMSPDGIWSEPLTYTFKVLPPFYRTWGAYAIYLLVLGSILYILYRARIKRLENAQASQLKTVIATQEEERKRISRDLHDDIGTKLSALKLFLSSLKNNAQKKEYLKVDTLAENSEQLIGETIKDVRKMLLNLSPGILEEFGFVAAIESLVNKINQAGAVRFDLSTFGIRDHLRDDYELTLYRIVQELINNTIKHAEAKIVSLQIGYREGKIIVMIEDDGKGFDVNAHKDGYGIKNLEARTKLLNGTIAIDSTPGKGTSVAIEVPYKFS